MYMFIGHFTERQVLVLLINSLVVLEVGTWKVPACVRDGHHIPSSCVYTPAMHKYRKWLITF